MFHSFCQNITIPLPSSWETGDTALVITWWSELKLNISLVSKIRVWGGHRAPGMWSYEECVRWPTLEPRTSYNSIESLVLVIFSPRTIISDVSNKYSTMSTINNLNDNNNSKSSFRARRWNVVRFKKWNISLFVALRHQTSRSVLAQFLILKNEFSMGVGWLLATS